MAKAALKKSPVGSSAKKSLEKSGDSPAAGKLEKLHRGGKTVPTFNAGRIDALESKAPMKDKSVKH